MTGYSPSAISGVENGHDSPSNRLRRLLIQRLDINEEWLRTGKGEMFKPVFWDDLKKNTAPASQLYSPEEQSIMEDSEFVSVVNKLRLMPVADCERYLKAMKRLLDSLRDADKNNPLNSKNRPLTNVSVFGNNEGVRAILPALIKRLQEATKERGSKTALAKFMGLPLPKISQWLSGEHEPGGENTLKLLHWVEQQERQK